MLAGRDSMSLCRRAAASEARELPVPLLAGTPDARGFVEQVRVDVEGGGGLAWPGFRNPGATGPPASFRARRHG